MRIRVVHETHYRYAQPARGLIQSLRLTPRDHDGQHVRSWRIEPSLDGRLSAREDGLGNVVHLFASEGPIESLTLRVSGEVDTHDTGGVVRGTVERAPETYYLRETGLTAADAAIRALADDAAGAAADPLDVLHRLCAAVHGTMTYDTGSTGVATSAAQAFALRRGVCQDLAQVLVAAARHRGIPARYVSGYFRRDDGVTDQEAGHGWAEALVPGLGWVGFDPANKICTTDAHLRLAVGLDYEGAAPIRGSRRGGGPETLSVSLRVEEPGAGQRQTQQ